MGKKELQAEARERRELHKLLAQLEVEQLAAPAIQNLMQGLVTLGYSPKEAAETIFALTYNLTEELEPGWQRVEVKKESQAVIGAREITVQVMGGSAFEQFGGPGPTQGYTRGQLEEAFAEGVRAGRRGR